MTLISWYIRELCSHWKCLCIWVST